MLAAMTLVSLRICADSTGPSLLENAIAFAGPYEEEDFYLKIPVDNNAHEDTQHNIIYKHGRRQCSLSRMCICRNIQIRISLRTSF